MPKYTVEIKEVHNSIFHIDGPEGMTRLELEEAAATVMELGPSELELEYSHTLDPDTWTIRTEGGDNVSQAP